MSLLFQSAGSLPHKPIGVVSLSILCKPGLSFLIRSYVPDSFSHSYISHSPVCLGILCPSRTPNRNISSFPEPTGGTEGKSPQWRGPNVTETGWGTSERVVSLLPCASVLKHRGSEVRTPKPTLCQCTSSHWRNFLDKQKNHGANAYFLLGIVILDTCLHDGYRSEPKQGTGILQPQHLLASMS